MKASDIVLQLASRLPQIDDTFTDNASVTSLTRSGTTVTVTTSAAHDYLVNQGVNIVGAETPIGVTSLTRSGTVGFLETDADHDFTLDVTLTVQIKDAVEANFNGTFTITSVTNRRNITFSMDDSGATAATGTPLVLNGSSVLQQYNGLHKITAVPTTTTFEYEITDTTLFTPASGTIVSRANARIASVISIDRLIDAYTEHAPQEHWLLVSTEDVVASKNRHILSDATDNLQKNSYFRQQIIQQVTIFLVVPTAVEQIAGSQAKDTAEGLFQSITKSILFKKFDSYLNAGTLNPLQFVSHGFQAYNTAYYIHRYSFEQVADLLFEDTVGPDEDVAFRDITLNMGLDIGTAVLTSDLDLDDEPLP